MAKERIALTEDEIEDRAAAEDLLTDEELATRDSINAERKAAREQADPEVDDAVSTASAAEEDGEAPAEPEAEAPAPAEPEPVAAAPVPAAPVEVVQFSDEEKARLDAIDGERDRITDAYDEGSLSREEMKAKLKDLNAEQAGLVSKQTRAEETQRAALAADVATWRSDVASWTAQHPVVAAMFAATATPEQRAAKSLLDEMVKKTAASALADDLDNFELLDQALAAARIRAPQAFAEAAPEPKTTAKQETPKAPRPELPPALSRLPAAESSAADSSQFAALDRLSGEKLEAAMVRLRQTSPAQYDAFMARA